MLRFMRLLGFVRVQLVAEVVAAFDAVTSKTLSPNNVDFRVRGFLCRKNNFFIILYKI